MSKAAIIIPAYNVAPYIHRAISSCIHQTEADIEIIIIDDGSTDETASVIAKYAREDSRIVFQSKKNQGVSSARNAGLDLATADYLLFLDADDWLADTAVEQLLLHLQQNKSMLICSECNYVSLESDGSLRKFYQGKHAEPFFLDRSEALHHIGKSSPLKLTSSCYRLYERRVIEENKLRFDCNIHQGEDGLFVFQYLNLVDGIYYFSDPLWNILDRPGSATSGGYNAKWKSAITAVDKMLKQPGLDRQTLENLRSLKAERAKLIQMVGIRTRGTPIEDIRFARSEFRKNVYYHLKGSRRIKWWFEAVVLICFPTWASRILMKMMDLIHGVRKK